MIEGVKIRKLVRHIDSRGHFTEILRDDDFLLKRFGQVSLSMTKPKIVKAFHWHKNQDDIFYAVSGEAQVVLYDRRKNSKTFRQLMAFKMSAKVPKIVFIPRGVAHGYKSIGSRELIMLYIMNKSYNIKNPDEHRIPFDDKTINFDWKKYR